MERVNMRGNSGDDTFNARAQNKSKLSETFLVPARKQKKEKREPASHSPPSLPTTKLINIANLSEDHTRIKRLKRNHTAL